MAHFESAPARSTKIRTVVFSLFLLWGVTSFAQTTTDADPIKGGAALADLLADCPDCAELIVASRKAVEKLTKQVLELERLTAEGAELKLDFELRREIHQIVSGSKPDADDDYFDEWQQSVAEEKAKLDRAFGELSKSRQATAGKKRQVDEAAREVEEIEERLEKCQKESECPVPEDDGDDISIGESGGEPPPEDADADGGYGFGVDVSAFKTDVVSQAANDSVMNSFDPLTLLETDETGYGLTLRLIKSFDPNGLGTPHADFRLRYMGGIGAKETFTGADGVISTFERDLSGYGVGFGGGIEVPLSKDGRFYMDFSVGLDIMKNTVDLESTIMLNGATLGSLNEDKSSTSLQPFGWIGLIFEPAGEGPGSWGVELGVGASRIEIEDPRLQKEYSDTAIEAFFGVRRNLP